VTGDGVSLQHCAVYSHVMSKCLAVFDTVLNTGYYRVWTVTCAGAQLSACHSHYCHVS